MPNRFLKESIRSSKKVNSLSDFDFRVWAYLITYVDDFGRGSADPELLKGFVFPRRRGVTESQIRSALDSLANIGMITLYEVDGESYFCFPNWSKHQQTRAVKSKFPAPDNKCYQALSNVPVFDNDIRYSLSDNDNDNENEAAELPENRKIVLSDYCNRINPMPSQRCIAELEDFTDTMGVEVCKRAFDIALDARITRWAYIRAILRRAKDSGVKCLADFEALEQKHEQKTQGKRICGVMVSAEQQQEVSSIAYNAVKRLVADEN